MSEGPAAIERVRRKVSKLMVQKAPEQRPKAGSSDETVLKAVYDYYSRTADKKRRFEMLASIAVEAILNEQSGSYARAC